MVDDAQTPVEITARIVIEANLKSTGEDVETVVRLAVGGFVHLR